MPTVRDGVRFRAKTGSHRRRAKPTRLTQSRLPSQGRCHRLSKWRAAAERFRAGSSGYILLGLIRSRIDDTADWVRRGNSFVAGHPNNEIIRRGNQTIGASRPVAAQSELWRYTPFAGLLPHPGTI
jgi:hypothetical protein